MFTKIATLFLLAATILLGCTSDVEDNFLLACGQGDATAVKSLIPAIESLDFRSFDGATPLTVAAKGGHLVVVTALVDGGASVQYTDISGLSALFWAAYMGNADVVEYLILVGADLSPDDISGTRITQIESDYPEIAAILREAGKLSDL